MRRVGERIVRQRGKDLLSDHVLPVPRLRQEEMAQLVGQKRLELGLGQLRCHRTVQDDVSFARYIGKRSVQPLGILRLVDRDGNLEPESPARVFGHGIDFGSLLPLHPIGGFQQVESNCVRLFVTDSVGRIPLPNTRLFCPKIVAHRLVIRQRLELPTRRILRYVRHNPSSTRRRWNPPKLRL